jgi:mercuric ion transport protein
MSGATLKRTLAALPGVGVTLLPKLMCPACWPAYAGIVSALGLGFVVSTKYLLLLTAAFLSITLASLGFRASRRHGYGPLWMGIFASAIILGGKFYFELPQLTYAGRALLVAASVWNSWPQRAAKASFCSACVPAEAGFNQGNTLGEPLHEAQNRSV